MKTQTQIPGSPCGTPSRLGWLLLIPALAISLTAQTNRPEINIQSIGATNAVLSWDDPGEEYIVLWASTLDGPWTPGLESIDRGTNLCQMAVCITGECKYFKLARGQRFEERDWDLEGWSVFYPGPQFGDYVTLEPTNGQLRLYANCASCPTRLVVPCRTNLVLGDFVASIDVLGWDDSPGNGVEIALMARAQPGPVGFDTPLYMGGLMVGPPDYPGESILWFWEGPVGVLGEYETFPQMDPTHDYRLVFYGVGSLLRLELFDLTANGDLVAEHQVEDDTLTEGYVGFMVQEQGPSGMMDFVFDNFVAVGTAPPPDPVPDFSLIGYATVNGNTTGGAGGPTQTVSTASAFISAVNQAGPLVIQVSGTIQLGTNNVDVQSDKTIVGLGTAAQLIGNLRLDGTTITNVIIRNLHFTNPDGDGTGDGISIKGGANHIWIDHCTFLDCVDEQCGITGAADYITISWCHFHYTTNQTDHRFSLLISGDDADAGNYRVTLHHNWWGNRVRERMPRVRYGDLHSFNNYFYSPGNNYCIRAALESEVLIENNYFDSVDEPWTKYVTTGTPPKVQAAGNRFVDVTGQTDPGTDTVFTPPYPYALDPANDVPAMVTANAGVGKGPFAP